jgi:LmbE family N-acetylglucosaminyl deacetylase
MLTLKWPGPVDGLKLLFLGAHCDDIEIGCGGTILRLMMEQKIKEIYWVVFTSNPERKKEALNSAFYFLSDFTSKRIEVKDLKDGFLPYQGVEVKNYFEEMKEFNPDVIFTHCRGDLHQDHRIINELTWNTFRNHLIMEYEIPKYDADLSHPNFFVPLDAGVVRKKIQGLQTCFTSQTNKQWFDEATFTALLRLRGLECASSTKFAEAFHVRKLTMD